MGAVTRATAGPGPARQRTALLVGGSAAGLSALSLLLPSVPTTDPWGWLVWGRQVIELALDTSGGGAPSWKPLPVAFTAPLSLAGDIAPQLWIVVARAGGLVALWLTYLLGKRLAGTVAGVAAALSLGLSEGWLRGALHGYTEPTVVAFLVGAVELHLRGRRHAALLAIAAAGLARPEAWALLGAYAVWLWRRERRGRPLAAAALVVCPAAWVGGDLAGSGDAFHGGESAQALTRYEGVEALDLVTGAFGGEMLVVLALAVAALVLSRDRLSVWLAGLGGAWTILVLALVELGYPASQRFMAPAVAAACVLAGAGAVRLWLWARASPRPRLVVAVGLAAASTLLGAVRLDRGAELLDAAEARARLQGELRDTVRELGPGWLMTCGPPVLPHDLHWNEGALAWELDVPLRRVRELSATEALAGGRASVVLAPRAVRPPPDGALQVVARAGRWRAYAPPSTPAAGPRCIEAVRDRGGARAAARPGPGSRRPPR